MAPARPSPRCGRARCRPGDDRGAARAGAVGIAATAVPSGTLAEITGGVEVNGAWTTAGNGLLTCGPDCAAHAANPNGSAQSNNGYSMRYVDTDSDASTFDSSSANLTIPAGTTVAKAWLMWEAVGTASHCGGSPTTMVQAQPVSAIETNSPLLAVDGGAYAGVGAPDYISDAVVTPPTWVNGAVDVTSLLSSVSAGTHRITVANLVASQGDGCSAGWALHVAYDYGRYIPGNADSTRRKLYTAFGNGYIYQASRTLSVSGFKTAGTGAGLVVSAIDGENGPNNFWLEWSGSAGRDQIANPIGGTTNTFVSIAQGAIPYADQTAADFRNDSIDTWPSTAPDVPTGTTSLTLRFGGSTDGIFPLAASLAVPVAALVIDKHAASGADTQTAATGQVPQFLIDVTNQSAALVNDATVTDAHVTGCVDDATGTALTTTASGAFDLGTLIGGATVTLRCTGPVVASGDRSYTNTATAAGVDINGDPVGPVSDSSDVIIPVVAVQDPPTRPAALAATGSANAFGAGGVALGLLAAGSMLLVVQRRRASLARVARVRR